jgi:methionyl-tRNA formyltransferase
VGIKLAYMGTSAFAVPVLVRLFEEGFTIAGVITQPDKPSGRGQSVHASPVKQAAHDLQLAVYQPATLKDDHARALFQAMEPDMIVVVAYGKILPPWLLKLPGYGAVNLHGSLLPRYRGAAPIHWAIANGETETGVCTMQVDEGLDTGPVYLCEKTSIQPDETVPELSRRLAILGTELMIRTIHGMVDGSIQPTPQDHSRATLAPILKKHHGFINWERPAHEIHNLVRAFNPWPGTVGMFRGGICKILKTRPLAEDAGSPGSISMDKRRLRVACGPGTSLEILELQPSNRKPISGSDFANGARIVAGEKFERVTDNEEIL